MTIVTAEGLTKRWGERDVLVDTSFTIRDGVTGLLRFWRITWPMLWSIRRVAAVYLLSNVLNVFALVFVMTQGGPDRATDTVLTFLYQTGFEQSNYGRASAVAATIPAIASVIVQAIQIATTGIIVVM